MLSLLSRPACPPIIVSLPSSRRLYIWGLSLFAAALAALSVLFYTFPPHYDSFFFGLDPDGVHQFQRHFGLEKIQPWNFRYFSRTFRGLIILLWMSYALGVAACLRGASPSARPLTALIGVVAAAVAVFTPPLLSTDSYAYLSHGQIYVLHGQNPYLYGPAALVRADDPVSHYLFWDSPTVYGPVWTWIEIGIAALLRTSGLWPQVIAFKMLEAGALLATALAGRRLTARLMPGWENVTLLAIGLNPMLLLEGPGSGHNDLVCLAFLLFGAALFLEKKYAAAALCLGLSVGIKPITLGLLPWALLEYSRGRSRRQILPALVTAPLLVLLPLALFFTPLWAGAPTLEAMQIRAKFGQNPEVLAQAVLVQHWLTVHGVKPGLSSYLVALFQNRLLILLYVVLSLWLWKTPRTGGWLTAWALFSFAVMFLFLKPPFPWYVTWFWPICLLRWDRWHLSLSAACLGLSLVLTFGYGELSSIGARPFQHWIQIVPAANGGTVTRHTSTFEGAAD